MSDKTLGYSLQVRGLLKDFQVIREEERIGMARAIHDQVGQELSVLSLTLAKMSSDAEHATMISGDDWRGSLLLLTSQVATLRDATRRIAFELRPDVLDASGLSVAAEDLVTDFCRRVGIRGSCEVKPPWQDPAAGTSLHLYRSLQELLRNVAQHAKASRVEVRLALAEGFYELQVADNGIGIPLDAVDSAAFAVAGRQGLRSVFERAALTHGTLTILTRPQVKGTEVHLRVPVTTKSPPEV